MSQPARVWKEASVLVTGHTGFKGGWLATWLDKLGAQVHGLALDPPTHPSFFDVAAVPAILATDTRGDITDLDVVMNAFAAARPRVVFHLAAQPLVLEGYREPIRTVMTNVMGTAHVLEAARHTDSVRSVVIVASDKVYVPRDTPAHESSALGGHDPYSASKAAAEIITAAYRSSYFQNDAGPQARIASVRAGNVIGGGDWARDRVVPDCLRAFERGAPVHIRNPQAVRPWQHVLEPLSGYLRLAENLTAENGARYSRAWNFGPGKSGEITVARLAELLAQTWLQPASVDYEDASVWPAETRVLRLDTAAAHRELNWKPIWSLREGVERTVVWHRAWLDGLDMRQMSLSQIAAHEAADR